MKLNPMGKRVARYGCDLIYFIICFMIVFAVIMSIYFYTDRLISDKGKIQLNIDTFIMLLFTIGLPFKLMGFFLGRAVKSGDCTIYDALRRVDEPAEATGIYVAVVQFVKDKGWGGYIPGKERVDDGSTKG